MNPIILALFLTLASVCLSESLNPNGLTRKTLAPLHNRPRFLSPFTQAKNLEYSPNVGAQHRTTNQIEQNCDERWREATLDHFNWAKPDGGRTTFKQRYFVCSKYWQPDDNGNAGPIFFYAGNEADVTLYLNNTGFMWEAAPDLGALVVFAEHRYYGKSRPYGKDVRKHMQYLSAEQAMADYVELLWELKAELNATDAPVIAFGGSYGGMLAAWLRMKYPHAITGSIAASAPIWNFYGEVPAFDPLSFSKGVTYDASEGGGSSKYCAPNARATWLLMEQLAGTTQGRRAVADSVGLCSDVPLSTSDDVLELRNWLAAAWDYMAMGNYPYESSYILNGDGVLPAYPVRVACGHLDQEDMQGEELLAAMSRAVGVFYNHSGDVECFDYREGVNPETDTDADFWDYQWCTEMFMPFAKDGESDMFWRDDFDPVAAAEGCKAQWGVTPRQLWATWEWGGRDIRAHSNIVFSNGLLDPWHGGGVLRDVSDSLISVIIPEGAHHLDLMFSHPDDPWSVKEARRLHRLYMEDWIRAARRGGDDGDDYDNDLAAGRSGSSGSSSSNVAAAGNVEAAASSSRVRLVKGAAASGVIASSRRFLRQRQQRSATY